MKKLLFLLTLSICLFSCYNPAPVSPPYDYIQSPSGQQMVVVRDNSGMETLMEYTLFMSLMNSGGYSNVINYYHVHQYAYPAYNRAAYSNWRPFTGRSYNSSSYSNYRAPSSGFRSSGNSSPVFKNTSPSSSVPAFRNTTPSSSKSSWFSSSKSSSSTPSSGFRSSSPSGSSGFRSSSSSSSFRSSGSSGFRTSSSSSYRSSSSGFRSSRH